MSSFRSDALPVDEVLYLAAMLGEHFASIRAAEAQMAPGSPEWERAGTAARATGFLLGMIQAQMQRRADEFAPFLTGDLDAGLRDLLDGGIGGDDR